MQLRSCISEPEIWEGDMSQKPQAGPTNQVYLQARIRGARTLPVKKLRNTVMGKIHLV